MYEREMKLLHAVLFFYSSCIIPILASSVCHQEILSIATRTGPTFSMLTYGSAGIIWKNNLTYSEFGAGDLQQSCTVGLRC